MFEVQVQAHPRVSGSPKGARDTRLGAFGVGGLVLDIEGGGGQQPAWKT